jgi:hypothetical protein
MYLLKGEKKLEKIINWTKENAPGLFIFNLIMIIFVLLHSAGYFHPFFTLTINIILILALILSAVLLKASSKVMFIVAIFFWLLTAFFKITFIDVWADRSSIYAFESLLIGSILFTYESIMKRI